MSFAFQDFKALSEGLWKGLQIFKSLGGQERGPFGALEDKEARDQKKVESRGRCSATSLNDEAKSERAGVMSTSTLICFFYLEFVSPRSCTSEVYFHSTKVITRC